MRPLIAANSWLSQFPRTMQRRESLSSNSSSLKRNAFNLIIRVTFNEFQTVNAIPKKDKPKWYSWRDEEQSKPIKRRRKQSLYHTNLLMLLCLIPIRLYSRSKFEHRQENGVSMDGLRQKPFESGDLKRRTSSKRFSIDGLRQKPGERGSVDLKRQTSITKRFSIDYKPRGDAKSGLTSKRFSIDGLRQKPGERSRLNTVQV